MMNAATIRILYEAYLANPDQDAWIFTNNAEPESLCAIYGAAGLSRIYQLGRSGSLEKQRMKYVISLLFSHAIPIQPEWLKFFQHFNAPSDLNEPGMVNPGPIQSKASFRGQGNHEPG